VSKTSTPNNTGLRKLQRSSVILITMIAIIIAAPISHTTVVGTWIAMVAMMLYLAFNASFVSAHFKDWKRLNTNEKVRLIIWCSAAMITATTFIRHEFSFFAAIVILIIDYTLARSANTHKNN
jgi:hypothetical protein